MKIDNVKIIARCAMHACTNLATTFIANAVTRDEDGVRTPGTSLRQQLAYTLLCAHHYQKFQEQINEGVEIKTEHEIEDLSQEVTLCGSSQS